MNINGIVTEGSDKCCGCTACLSVCPKHCITMSEDKEGFLYPKVDGSLCIDCEQCVIVCPFHNPSESSIPTDVYAAYNKEEEIRLESSSGGVFTLMAEKIINEGGVVFGARFTDDWQVQIVPTETIDGLAAFRGSKYLQASVGNSYKQTKEYLMQGEKVLFSGTPCQIAGLKHYLRKNYNNLLTMDFVCHGVPTPKVWRMYLQEVTEAGKKAILDIKFHDKPNGWKRFNFTLSYDENDKSYILSSFNGDNHYMRAFLQDMILRPSCYSCQAKCGRSHSDITIADYWGIDQTIPQMDDDKGTSLLLVHTDKGREALDFSQMKYVKSDYNDALRFNPAIERSAKPHRHRKDFFDRLDTSHSLITLIDKELKPSLRQQASILYHRCRHKAKNLILRLLGGGKPQTRCKAERRFVGVVPRTNGRLTIEKVYFRNQTNGWKQYRMEIYIK